MKKHKAGLLAAAVALGLSASPAMADIYLFDWAFYVDETTYENFSSDSMPTSGLLDGSGLGTLTWSTSVAGDYTFLAFFDYEISEATNTFFNGYGEAIGTPDAAQSWEIDEPGWDVDNPGDIYTNLLAGLLDNTNGVPDFAPNDVSFAMGWNFILGVGQTAEITLNLSDSAPTSGFYLTQYDPDSDESIFFSSSLDIRGGTEPVPEPATMLLMGTGLAGLLGIGRKKMKKA